MAKDEFVRGYFSAVAALLNDGFIQAAQSLFQQGNNWEHADPADIETIRQFGLITDVPTQSSARTLPVKMLNVWAGLARGRGKQQVNTIVATTTKKRAMEILGVNSYEFNNRWSNTSNELALSIALAQPEVVFQASTEIGEDYVQVDFKG